MINNYNKNLLHENIILSSISSCINEEVKHIVPCTTIMKNASTHKYTEVEIFLIFSRTQIHISLCSLITIKNSFSYEHITSVVIDTEFNQVLKITFDTERLPQSQSKFQSLILSTSDRSALVKHLLLYHSLYNFEKYGTFEELSIKKLDDVGYKVQTRAHNNNICTSISPFPFYSLYMTKHSFICFLYDGAEIIGNDTFLYYDPNFNRTCVISININEERELDYLQYKSDENILKDVLRRKVNIHMKNEKWETYSISGMGPFTRRMNFGGDNTVWSGYFIEIRTNENTKITKNKNNKENEKEYNEEEKNNIKAAISNKQGTSSSKTQRILDSSEENKKVYIKDEFIANMNKNYKFVYLRQKYIPPFYDRYRDYLFVFTETYPPPPVVPSPSPKYTSIFTTTINSLHQIKTTSPSPEQLKILIPKLEGLLFSENELEYIFSNFGFIGQISLVHGMNYVCKLLTMILENNKFLRVEDNQTILENILEQLWEKIEIKGREVNSSYNRDEHEKALLHSKIEDIIENFYLVINTTGSLEYYNTNKIVWMRKIWMFLGFCVNGGVTNNRLNYDLLIRIYENELKIAKTYKEDEKKTIPLLCEQFINLLDIYIENKKGEVLFLSCEKRVIKSKPKKKIEKKEKAKSTAESIGSKSSSSSSKKKEYSSAKTLLHIIKEKSSLISIFEYNQTLLYSLIKNCVLNKILCSKEASSSLILFILNFSFPNITFIRCIKVYIRETTIRGLENERSQLFSIIPIMMSLYSQSERYPILAFEACKILYELTVSESDRSAKLFLLTRDILYLISKKITSPNEKEVKISLKLALNVLSEIKENINTLLSNQQFLSNLLSIIKGKYIPGLSYEMETVILTIKILNELVESHGEILQKILNEILSNDYQLIIQGFKNYIEDNEKAIGSHSNKDYVDIQCELFKFLYLYSRNNIHGRELLIKNGFIFDCVFIYKSTYMTMITNDVLKGEYSEELKYTKLLESYLQLTYYFYSTGKLIEKKISSLKGKIDYVNLINLIYKNHKNNGDLYNLFTLLNDFKSNTNLIK